MDRYKNIIMKHNNIQKIVSNIILKNNIDIASIKKLIESYNYNTEDIFYNLEFPISWKGKYKKAYTELRFLVDSIFQEFENNVHYKNIDCNIFWIYFKKHISELLI